MIKTIIFDIGGVLVNLHFDAYFSKFSKNPEITKRLCKATLRGPVWEDFDRGVLTQEELTKKFMKQDPEIEELIKEAVNDFDGFLDMRDYAIPWINELREKGYQVLYLSNWPREFHKKFYADMKFIPYMDGGILSYLEKVIKPEVEIYELLMKRYNLKANECVFLDDTMKNLTTAKELGMETILYTTKEDAIIKFEKMGIK